MWGEGEGVDVSICDLRGGGGVSVSERERIGVTGESGVTGMAGSEREKWAGGSILIESGMGNIPPEGGGREMC